MYQVDRARNIDTPIAPGDNRTVMIEHAFMLAMLAFVALLVVVQSAVLGYLTYRVWRGGQQTEAMIAATYLEVRRALSQTR